MKTLIKTQNFHYIVILKMKFFFLSEKVCYAFESIRKSPFSLESTILKLQCLPSLLILYSICGMKLKKLVVFHLSFKTSWPIKHLWCYYRHVRLSILRKRLTTGFVNVFEATSGPLETALCFGSAFSKIKNIEKRASTYQFFDQERGMEYMQNKELRKLLILTVLLGFVIGCFYIFTLESYFTNKSSINLEILQNFEIFKDFIRYNSTDLLNNEKVKESSGIIKIDQDKEKILQNLTLDVKTEEVRQEERNKQPTQSSEPSKALYSKTNAKRENVTKSRSKHALCRVDKSTLGEYAIFILS